VAYGQARVLVAWHRIIFLTARRWTLARCRAPTAGYTGFKDQVQTHYMRVFSAAFLMSAVVAGITYSSGRDQTDAFGRRRPAVR
jgi:type IV secretion system protein VirB10